MFVTQLILQEIWVTKWFAECSVPQPILYDTQCTPKLQTILNFFKYSTNLKIHYIYISNNPQICWYWRFMDWKQIEWQNNGYALEMILQSWNKWRRKYESFRIKRYLNLHNNILKVFWSEMKNLEVTKKILGGTGRKSPAIMDLLFSWILLLWPTQSCTLTWKQRIWTGLRLRYQKKQFRWFFHHKIKFKLISNLIRFVSFLF